MVSSSKRILLTGGAGYIGSHVALVLLERGHDLVVIDNLVNGHEEALDRVQLLSGRSFEFQRLDLLNRRDLMDMDCGRIDAVMHFAALKSVPLSVAQPLACYQNNVSGTLHLLEFMAERGINELVFSSSAAVYDASSPMPVTESSPLGPVSPYGRTKLMMEQAIADCCAARPQFRAVNLRYFNPVGAHESGRLGEDPLIEGGNLMPYILKAASGHGPSLQVTGVDFDTADGSGVRDFIHVMDLAEAHASALDCLQVGEAGCELFNIGTGHGHSVLEVIAAFEQATGVKVPWVAAPRRPGDIDSIFANVEKANRMLGWHSRRSMSEACRDAWRWQQSHPAGFRAGKFESGI